MLDTFYSKLESWLSSSNFKQSLKDEQQNKKLLNAFLEKFDIKKLNVMTIDEYVVGKENKHTFCYQIEYTLLGYGSIRGRPTAAQRYGIFWDGVRKDYSFGGKKVKKTRFGSDKDEIFNNIRSAIISLLDDIENNMTDNIIANPLSPQFKNKIGFLYNSTSQIPIYSDDDLNIILAAINIPFSISADRFVKRQKLYDFYKDNGLDEKFSPLLFMNFIYSDYGYLNLLRAENKVSLTEKEAASIKKIKLVDIRVIEELKPKKSETARTRRIGKYNPETEERKRITGKKAEQIVIEYLNSHKDELKIDGEIVAWCDIDDGIGYDISYKQLDKKDVFIEVKSTIADRKDRIVFEISANQREIMNNHPDNYYIFFVNNVNNATEIKRILAKNINEKNYEPVKFRVNVKTNSAY